VKKNKPNELLKDLEERIDNAEMNSGNLNRSKVPSNAKEYSTGMRTLFELIVGFSLGSLIGYYIDLWLESSPIFLLVGMFLGGISGIYSIWRRNISELER
jgi:F0F1-type ATP synthase assembly protein I